MAKKIQNFSKEYLEDKLKNLYETRIKVEATIDKYVELYQRINGGIEIIESFLSEASDEVSDNTASKDK